MRSLGTSQQFKHDPYNSIDTLSSKRSENFNKLSLQESLSSLRSEDDKLIVQESRDKLHRQKFPLSPLFSSFGSSVSYSFGTNSLPPPAPHILQQGLSVQSSSTASLLSNRLLGSNSEPENFEQRNEPLIYTSAFASSKLQQRSMCYVKNVQG